MEGKGERKRQEKRKKEAEKRKESLEKARELGRNKRDKL